MIGQMNISQCGSNTSIEWAPPQTTKNYKKLQALWKMICLEEGGTGKVPNP